MADIVLDASAVLALLNAEPDAEQVAAVLPGTAISTVNITEVITRLIDWNLSQAEIDQALDALGLQQHAFDADQARMAASLRTVTHTHTGSRSATVPASRSAGRWAHGY
ncbi:MAG: hypothetical protein RBR77_06865 [Thauera sp.]|jgi:PIN domain nuclease of toxin-antitoxin system|nr:hypothetical protein [Thauera sp.]